MNAARFLPSALFLLVSGATISRIARGADSVPPEVQQVIVVFKTHFDIGYTDMASNVVHRYRTTMIDDALKVVDQNRNLPPEQQFVWTIPGWPMKKITEDWPGQRPERQAKILRAFKDGRFVVHALPFSTHTELLELEDLVRGMNFSSRLSREAGLALPRDAKMTDVPCHSWVLPTLLRHAGVEFLHLGCNAASSSPQVPLLFWWEGPDGSRLLTMYSAAGYGTGLLPPADWPHKTWLALIQTGDNHGPPRPEEVKKLLDEAKQKLPGVTIRIGRLSDFADAILAENSAIPVVRGDMPDTWIHGPMSDPQGAATARNIRPLIATTECLNTHLRVWGVPAPDLRRPIAEAYEQSLLYGEHTWGGAQYWITKYGAGTKWSYGDAWKRDRAQGRFQRLEASWAEHTAYIQTTCNLVTPLLQTELAALARAVNVRGQRVVVFNPLPWKRDGWVSLDLAVHSVPSFKPADGGANAPSALINHLPGFLAQDIPAMGYRTYLLTSAERPAAPTSFDAAAATLESPFFKAALDTNHFALRSLRDKRSGRELVDDRAAPGFGQYLYERFDSNNVAAFVRSYVKTKADWAFNELGKPNLPLAQAVPYRAWSPSNFTVHFEQDAHAVSATGVADASPGSVGKIRVTFTLSATEPRVDMRLTLDKDADPWPEAGWLCLPFKLDTPQFRVGRQNSIIDPAKDIVRGANRRLLGINTGVVLFDPEGRGVGLCPIDNPLVSLGEPGCWKYSLDYVPTKPAVFVNLFNNQWTTNFRLWNQGPWTARIRLWAFDRYDPVASLITPSWEARVPLQATVAEGAAGRLPPTCAGLELSRRGVLVTAFGPNPDGPGTVLRLWEAAGASGSCRVRLPAGMEVPAAQPVDLRGRRSGQAIAVQNREFTLDLAAFAPASVVLSAAN